MFKNLQIEWLKIKNYRAFWIFMGLYLISIIAINYIAFYIYRQTVKDMPMAEAILKSPYSFPKVWQTVGWMGSWLLYFPGIIIILLASNEFSFKTHRQNIIDGWSRNEFVYTKLMLVFIVSIAITIITTVTSVIFGVASGSDFTLDGSINIFYVFIQSLSYISLALLCAVVFRRSGVALIVFVIYGLIFESILCFPVLNRYVQPQLGFFLPLETTDTLVPIPFAHKTIYKNAPESTYLLIAAIAYLLLYYYLVTRKFKTDDL